MLYFHFHRWLSLKAQTDLSWVPIFICFKPQSLPHVDSAGKDWNFLFCQPRAAQNCTAELFSPISQPWCTAAALEVLGQWQRFFIQSAKAFWWCRQDVAHLTTVGYMECNPSWSWRISAGRESPMVQHCFSSISPWSGGLNLQLPPATTTRKGSSTSSPATWLSLHITIYDIKANTFFKWFTEPLKRMAMTSSYHLSR